MELKEMQEHLTQLASWEGVRLDQAPNMAGMMYVEFGYVEGPTIEEDPSFPHYPNAESRYLVCLHEIGHYNYGHTQGRPWTDEYRRKAFGGPSEDDHYWTNRQHYFDNGVLRSEAEAWNYALDQCKIPDEEIKLETRNFMWYTCLGSYFENARLVGFTTPGQRLGNGDRAYVPFAYGKPDHYFFQTKRRILEGNSDEGLLKDPPSKKSRKTKHYLNIDPSATIQWTDTSTTISNTLTYWNFDVSNTTTSI